MGLDTVELIVSIENYFGIRVPDTEAEQMGTVQEIADGVCRLRGGCDSLAPSAVREQAAAVIRQALQAALHLPASPATATPLARLRPTTAARWQPLLAQLQYHTGWLFPKFTDPWQPVPPTSWLGRLFAAQPERWIDWRQSTVSDLVDWTVALNYQRFYHGPLISGAYDVLRVVIGIVADCSGVDIWEIRPADSITRDLGMD